MVGRPRIYDRRQTITTSIQGIFYDLAREKHISWKLALEAGIKLLAQGGESPALESETIQKHLKIEEHMANNATKDADEISKLNKTIEELECGSEIKNNNEKKKDYRY
jgi:hypothetical protein